MDDSEKAIYEALARNLSDDDLCTETRDLYGEAAGLRKTLSILVAKRKCCSRERQRRKVAERAQKKAEKRAEKKAKAQKKAEKKAEKNAEKKAKKKTKKKN